ncbi:MAG: hypothetical protein AMJ73_04620 [candidate division Zixibacteria bacterium SM1_73]|nr:MAG: hypothetical protein AMJ73_04620 [candidate division Zixibacteria bacterium SM1_73]
MSKKILFCVLFILIFLIPSKQDPNAKTWLPGSKIPADSIARALIRGECVNIDSCLIYNPLIMGGTMEKIDTIKGEVNIRNSVFLQEVLIAWSHFLKQVRLVDNSFRSVFLCNGNIFNDWVIIARDSFSDMAAISQNTFGGIASFEESIFDSLVLFAQNLFRKEWNFRETRFKQKVDFTLSEFETIRITWKQLDGHLIFYPPLFSKLLQCLEQQRQLDDADEIYLFLKDHERIEKPKVQRYLEYWFIQQTCGYGVKPSRTLIVCALVIILFSVFYTKSNAIREIQKEFGHRRRRRGYRIVRKRFRRRVSDALYFSVQTFIIGVVPAWQPTDEFLINTKRIRLFKFRTLAMIEGALGWILLVLFVVTLTRKFIR